MNIVERVRMSGIAVKVTRAIVAATIMTAAGASLAQAQETLVVAKVPFNFIVGDTKLPAGDYRVKSIENEFGLVAIESTDGNHRAVVMTVPTTYQPIDQPSLMFDKFNGQMFLARIVTDQANQQEIPLTPEKMAQEGAAAAMNP